MLYKPNSLELGSKIGLVNPAGEMNQQYAETTVPRVIRYLEGRGFRVPERRKEKIYLGGIQDPNVLRDYIDPYTSEESDIRFSLWIERRSFLARSNVSPKERAQLFNDAVMNCDAVFPLVGNRFGTDIIGHIDYEGFKQHRPIFVTFSAASAFLLHLHLKTNTVVFYGPHVHFLAGYENSYTVNSFWNFLKQENQGVNISSDPVEKYAYRKEKEFPSVLKNIYSTADDIQLPPSERIPFLSLRTNQSSSLVTGKLIPIFLFSLEEALTQKGSVDFNPKGTILMVEADERTYDDCFAALQSVHQQADLSKLSALVLASFIAYKPESESLGNELIDTNNTRNFVSRVRELLKDNVPVIYGFPMGHSKYKLTIPMGVQAELNIETGDITLKESPFSNI